MRTIGLLLRQRARRDAVSLAVWLAGLAALAVAGYPGVRSSYGDEQERVALLGTVMANPVVLLFRGLPSGAGEAQMVAFLLLPWLLLLVALMCSFLAVRHTRGDEEDGRLELVSATAAGRTAPLVATALHGVGASIVAGAVVAVIFVASGAPPVGAALIAAGCTLAGTVFLGVGLVSAELMPTSRAANALAVWLVVGTFALAGTGNALGTPSADLTRMTSSALAWFSPFGWAENTRPFDTDDAWPLAASVLATLVLLGGAALLHARRDLGASFVPPRTGRAAARPGFATHLALTVRQSRAAGIGWIVAGLLVGIVSTSLAGVASRIGEGNPAVTSLLQALSGTSADLSRGLIVVFFVMPGIFAACAATQTVLRARQDETQGTDPHAMARRPRRRRGGMRGAHDRGGDRGGGGRSALWRHRCRPDPRRRRGRCRTDRAGVPVRRVGCRAGGGASPHGDRARVGARGDRRGHRAVRSSLRPEHGRRQRLAVRLGPRADRRRGRPARHRPSPRRRRRRSRRGARRHASSGARRLRPRISSPSVKKA